MIRSSSDRSCDFANNLLSIRKMFKMHVTNYVSVNGRMLSEVTDGVILNYVPDPLGSIHSVVDQTATAVKTMRYKPYGEVLSRSGSISDRMYQWVGPYGYRATFNYASSHYVRARHYSQTPGSWTTVDPVWPNQNGYLYCGSNPAGNLDPSGYCPIRCKPTEECVYVSAHNCPGEPYGARQCRPRSKRDCFAGHFSHCMCDIGEFANRLVPNPTQAGRQNAIAHYVTACMITAFCPSSAFDEWQSRERKPECIITRNACDSDRHNNEIGRRIGGGFKQWGPRGLQLTGDACVAGCTKAWNNGQLKEDNTFRLF